MLVIIGVTLLFGMTALTLFWVYVGRRVRAFERDQPSLREGASRPAPDDGWPRLSIVLPAHNEERVIEGCVTSLRAVDYPSVEFIFVLDRCTDRTASILAPHVDADNRILIIENDSCPPDWAGKCNALRLGAEQATGEYVLFTDADTGFDRDLPRAAVSLAREHDMALLTLLSTLTIERPFERLAQPIASMSLMKMFPAERINRPAGQSRPFANGQFLLFHRSWYDRIGGHEAVHEALLEDLAFARRINAAGGRIGVLLADGMLRVSMYGTFEAFRRGWKRIFIEACQRKPARLRKNAYRLYVLGGLVPVMQIAGIIVAGLLLSQGSIAFGAVLFVMTALAVTAQCAALLRIYHLAGAPLWSTILYPAGCVIVGGIMREAAHDLETGTPIRWGGREYVLEPR